MKTFLIWKTIKSLWSRASWKFWRRADILALGDSSPFNKSVWIIQDGDGLVHLLCRFLKYPGPAGRCGVRLFQLTRRGVVSTGFCLICWRRMLVQNGWTTQAPPTSPAQSRARGKVRTGSQSMASSAGTANHYLHVEISEKRKSRLSTVMDV